MSPYSHYEVTVLAFHTHADWEVWDKAMASPFGPISPGAAAACYSWDATYKLGKNKTFQTIALCLDSQTLAEDIVHEVTHAATNHMHKILNGSDDDETRAEITSFLSIQALSILGLTE